MSSSSFDDPNRGQPRPSYDQIDLPRSEDEVKELLKRVVEAANNSLVITDVSQPDNPIVYVNQGFKALTGYDEEEILGRNCRFLQIDGAGNHHRDQVALDTLRTAVANGRYCRTVLRNFRKNGEMFWNELYLTPVYNPDGEVTHFVGVQNDVTERVQLNKDLERRVEERTRALEQQTQALEQQRDELARAKENAEAASRAKSAFLANMSHEIRTPLTAILGLADVMRAKSEGNQFDEHIRRIKSAGSRLMDTLSSLLTLAKLEADSMNVDLEPVPVADEVLEVVELFRERAEKKGLDMRFSLDEAAHHATARLDAGALNSVLQNLISNAVKFTDTGHIEVRVEVQRNGVAPQISVSVADTGIGIGEGFQSQLFESFQQESEGLTREYDGSGLGLSIAKQLVEAMDGTIAVASEAGEGSTFTVSFPLAENGTSARATESGAPAMPRSDGRVLAVEDNDNTVFLLRSLLDDVVELSVAQDMQEALQQTEAQAFDVLLIDINLGAGGSGVDVLRALRERPAYADVPMVAVTAVAMPGDRERLRAAGFDEYLAKPFAAEALLETVERFL